MKKTLYGLATVILLLRLPSAFGTEYYVNANNTAPSPPYTNWISAATNIQAALNEAVAGDDILVTNGVYQPVTVTNAVSLQSVNGPTVTRIDGAGAARCVYLAASAVLTGFTLTNGSAGSGGGVYCASSSSVVSNCVLTANAVSSYGGTGGGDFGGTLINCTLSGNHSSIGGGEGGGAASATLINCTVSGNSSYAQGAGVMSCVLTNCALIGNSSGDYGGGADSSTLWNCILTGNSCDNDGGGADACTLYNCLLTLNSASGYGGGMSFGNAYNCTVVGNSAGEQGGGTVGGNGYNCIICYNSPQDTYNPGTYSYCYITGNPQFANTNGWSNLRLLPGSPCINAGNNSYAFGATDLDGNPRISGGTVDIGAYESQPFHFVSLTGTNPQVPYDTWAIAATNIQDAVDAAVAGDEIEVSNGVYQTGGRVVSGMSNRVAVTKLLNLYSINGAAATSIVGSGPNGPAAVRCVYLTNGSYLIGFTLTNGAVQTSGDPVMNMSGGGVLCASSTTYVIQCVISGNSGFNYGGGIYSGILYDCVLTANAAAFGGGAYAATLYNCTLAGNSAYAGGGTCDGALYNCIVYDNTAAESGNNYSGDTFQYCCTTPLPSGAGNLSSDPLFANTNGWSNLRLQIGSPCINTGNNAYAPGFDDLDGNPRIMHGTVDMGAYEVQALIVTMANDSVAGTLRSAIGDSSSGDTITFAPGLSGATILLTNGQLVLNNNLTIDASALPSGITINGNQASRIFQVGVGVTAVLNSLTITNGIDSGAGNQGGAGILSYGTLTLNNCTLAGNSAQSSLEWGGGGILSYHGTLTLNQCTVAGNSTASYGGGIYLHSYTLTLNQCTLTANSAGDGGGIDSGGSATINNSIVAGNSAPSGANLDGGVIQTGNNLTSGAPLLAPLGNYGGPTPTMPPQFGSPALGAGSMAANTFATDQRGYPRTQNGLIDIGAVEAQACGGNPPRLTGPARSGSGSFQFAFSNNTPGVTFTVFTTTNLALPFTNWTVLGVPIEMAPGQFQFTDAQATNSPQRFYRVTSP